MNLMRLMRKKNEIEHLKLIGDGFDQNPFFFIQAFLGKNTDSHNHRIIVAGCDDAVTIYPPVDYEGFVADAFDDEISISPGLEMLLYRS